MKITLVPLIILTVLILSACRKQADTIANIYVKDEASLLVDSAMVVLYGENTTGLPNTLVECIIFTWKKYVSISPPKFGKQSL